MNLTKKMKNNKKQIESTLTDFMCDRIQDLFFRIKETSDNSGPVVPLCISKEDSLLLRDALTVYLAVLKETKK